MYNYCRVLRNLVQLPLDRPGIVLSAIGTFLPAPAQSLVPGVHSSDDRSIVSSPPIGRIR